MINTLIKDIRLFTLQESVQQVVDYLQKEGLTTVFVVENELFLGVISLELLEGLDSSKTLNHYAYLLKTERILNDLHWFHAFELFSSFQTNVLAVVNEHQQYLGAYRFEDLNRGILNLSLIKQAGFIIVLSINEEEAVYKPIVDIVERNEGKLLGVLTTIEEEQTVELTLKIAVQNCDRVVDALSRSGYQIVYSDASNHLKDTLKDNASYFNAYLNL